MCGIVGELRFDHQASDPGLVTAMRDAIKHRGPDSAGLYCQGPVGLGFRRLAIIDLSPAGNQPMFNQDKSLVIIFNGEIYNYRELRQQLEARGRTFRTQTDTEAILALYEEYGVDCLQHLRGMFAFAIWDTKQQQLFIARDRLGKKPLKYFADDQGIIFASELKGILKHPRVPRQVDPAAIDHYLTLQYVPTPLTGFMGIRKLRPAHYLLIKNGQITEQRYWQLRYRPNITKKPSEWVEEIRRGLDESVRLRMMSDVPLGAFLSGGIDSSAVVAMMAKHSARAVKTFSIGFGEASHNELPYAKQIAELFRTDHTEFVVEPNAVEVLPHLAYHYEEPFADSSALPTYYLSKLTREHVTVALNGDGGDENFAGYERYPIWLLADRYRRWMPAVARRIALAAARAVRQAYPSTMTDRAQRFAASAEYDRARRHLEYMQYFSDEQKKSIFTKEFAAQVASHPPTWELIEAKMQEAGTNDPINQLLYADITSYLPDDLLVKVDIATMAVSLEGRSPLLDHRFMEMTATIPSNLKVRGQQKKYIFRQALRGIIPDQILDRKKMGFGVPIEHWFRGSLNGYLRQHLVDGPFARRGIIKPEFVQQLVDRHTHGGVSYAYQLWSLLMLEMWYEAYFDDRH